MLLKINGDDDNQASKRLCELYGPRFCVPAAAAGGGKELGVVVVSPAVGQGMNCTKMLLTDVLLTIFFFFNLNFFRQSHAFPSPAGRKDVGKDF